MPHPLHRSFYRFLIDNISRTKTYLDAKPFLNHLPQHIRLNLAHELDMDFIQLFSPDNMKQRFFFLQKPQLSKHRVYIAVFGKFHPVRKHRFQHRKPKPRILSQPFPGTGFCKPCHRTDRPRLCLSLRFILNPGIDADLVHLFLPVLPVLFPGQNILYLKPPPGKLHPGQPIPLFIPGNLKHPCTESLRPGRIIRHLSISTYTAKKFLHPFQLQRRTEIAGKYLSLPDKCLNFVLLDLPGFQISL